MVLFTILKNNGKNTKQKKYTSIWNNKKNHNYPKKPKNIIYKILLHFISSLQFYNL